MREEQKERALLLGVKLNDGEDFKKSMEELAALSEACGMEVVGTITQNMDRQPHASLYMGRGKLGEVQDYMLEHPVDVLIFDRSLTPSQMRNLQNILDCPILDRTTLILEIFASRARTREAKLQVESARLQYVLPRLTGMHKALSRQGGGSGVANKGAGEKKLELDRRRIEKRISELRKELDRIAKERETQRQKRQGSGIPRVALVGYTNAGKSTLLNTLTDADVLEEDQLFATLDPTTRMLELSNHQNLMLTDTVGFIRKLPHHLVDAFKSTLEEAKYADFIIHVVDASNPQWDAQMHVVYMTLQDLGVVDKKILTVFNKCDRITGEEILQDFRADKTLRISAKTGMGLDTLKEVFEDMLRDGKVLLKHTFPYEKAGEIQKIRKYGELLKEEYRPEGIYVEAYVPPEL